MENRLERLETLMKPYIEAPEGFPKLAYMFMRMFVEKNLDASPDLYRKHVVSEMVSLKKEMGAQNPELLEKIATVLAMI